MTDCENVIQEQVRGLGDWVLVPRVPTDAMLRAAQSAWLNDPQRRTTTMWRAMLAAAQQQPAEGDEIMVNTPYDVFILPLRPSGLDGKGPRFVVHVPGPEQPAAPSGAVNVIGMPEFDELLDHIYEYGTAAEGVIEKANAFARAVIARYAPQQPAEIEALRAEVERLNRLLGRIVEGDGDSTLTIRAGTDAFAAAREYLLRDQEEGK